jgi:hypothetical protein
VIDAVSVGTVSVGTAVLEGIVTVDLGESFFKHASPWLLFPVTVISRLVLATLSPG